ncbi:hypothetical protein HDZ31DRAFT_36412 [Schizophyllum fasciatum]
MFAAGIHTNVGNLGSTHHTQHNPTAVLSILTPGAQRRLWDFPNEIWIQIFEAVGNSTDLLSAYRTCRLFRQLALEPMFEDLRFTRTHRALTVARVLDHNPNLRRRVRSLTLEELQADWDDSLSVPPWAPVQPRLRDVTLFVLDARAGTELRNLPAFLAARPNITSLRVEASDPAVRMTAARMPGLRKFTGAPGVARAVLPDSGARAVDTTAYAAHVPNVISLLEACPRELADLRIALRTWDEEILYAIAQLLTELTHLEVWYHGGCPRDTFIMSLGTQLIPRMRRLRVLKVFPLPGAGGAADATDAARADDMHNENRWKPMQRGVFSRAQVRGFLSAWTRYCPALMEVKLAPSSYWVRDDAGTDWNCVGE